MPYGRIAGRRESDGFHIQYTDSFSGSKLTNAKVRNVGGQLEITHTGESPAYLDLDIGNLSRVRVDGDPAKKWRIDYIAGGTYDSCIRNRMNPSGYLREGMN